MVGEREQIVTISRRIVILRNEKSGKFGPLSHRRSRINPKSDRLLVLVRYIYNYAHDAMQCKSIYSHAHGVVWQGMLQALSLFALVPVGYLKFLITLFTPILAAAFLVIHSISCVLVVLIN